MLGDAKSARLSFDSHDDTLDYARKFVEDAVRWQSVHELNAADRYLLLRRHYQPMTKQVLPNCFNRVVYCMFQPIRKC